MKKSAVVLVVQILLLLATIAVAMSIKVPDFLRPSASAASNQACYRRIEGDKECETSFRRLMGSERLAGEQSIRLLGFLAVRNGVPILYPDKASYDHDVVVDAIALEGSFDELKKLDGHWYTTVRVAGSFADSPDVGSSPWFGELRGPFSVWPVSVAVREDPKDLRIKVE